MRACGFEIDCAAPGGLVGVDQIGAEFAGVVSHWAEVVVHNIEQHSEALFMRCIHKSLQSIGATVLLVHREESDAVVAQPNSPENVATGMSSTW